MIPRFLQAGLSVVALAAALLPPSAVGEDTPAPADYLDFESVLDGKCQILSDGGKLRVMHNRHASHSIRFRLIRVFAGKPQGRSIGVVEPNSKPYKLGCTRVDGRIQDWTVEKAHFQPDSESEDS